MIKKMIALWMIITVCLTGCGKQDVAEESVIFAQNDYGGCYSRLTDIQQKVVDAMAILDTHNYTVMEGNPDDYWDEEGFHYVHFIPMKNEVLDDVAMLNEVDNFAAVQEYITSVLQAQGYSDISVIRKEKDHYLIKYSAYLTNRANWSTNYGARTMACRYDPAYNRLQVVSTVDFSLSTQDDFFYEFAELGDGRYAFQTDTERLFVEMQNGAVTGFVYSELLDPEETVKDAESVEGPESTGSYELPPVYLDKDTEFAEQEKGLAEAQVDDRRYTVEQDSIFKNLSRCSREWACERGALRTVVELMDGELSVTAVNDFTKEKIQFTVREKEA